MAPCDFGQSGFRGRHDAMPSAPHASAGGDYIDSGPSPGTRRSIAASCASIPLEPCRAGALVQASLDWPPEVPRTGSLFRYGVDGMAYPPAPPEIPRVL